MLNDIERMEHLVFVGSKRLRDLGCRDAKVSVVVQAFDDELADVLLARRTCQQMKLLDEIIGKGAFLGEKVSEILVRPACIVAAFKGIADLLEGCIDADRLLVFAWRAFVLGPFPIAVVEKRILLDALFDVL